MNRILAAVDLTDATQPVLRNSAEWARAEHAKLAVLYAMPMKSPMQTAVWSGSASMIMPIVDDNAEYADSMDRVRRAVDALALAQTECLCQRGAPVETIRDVAVRIHADLIVIGSHGHGRFFHTLFGSVREALLADPPCPVLVVPGRKVLS